jgi:hypothetical protein
MKLARILNPKNPSTTTTLVAAMAGIVAGAIGVKLYLKYRKGA